jgi:hypothetical protein
VKRNVFKWLAGAVALLLAAAVASGCGGGGGGGSSDTASERLSPTEFAAEGKSVCERGRQELSEALVTYQKENGSVNPSDVGTKAVAGTLLPVQRRELARLEALAAPEEAAAHYEDFLEARKATLDEIEKDGISSNGDLLKAFERSDKMAVALRLEACSYR